jgi:DNA (cytosine-5)-methyltransferase 1
MGEAEMKHLGDITKINGAEIEIVDVITGGSPCQDLSIAGKRAGLAGARSGLFMEQVRIVKEMRQRDRANGRTGDMVRPRFMVWENVPGAFSSNKGRDFAAVLEEIIRIAEPEAPDIEVPEKGWPTWGGYHDEVGGRWSVAWRVHDAQHWGVPQRRRRISVVADFGGDTAGEILFERKSVSRHPEESGTARERLADGAESGAGGAGKDSGSVICLKGNAIDRDTAQNGKWYQEDKSYTLDATDRHGVCAGFKLGNSEHARSIGYAEEQAPTLNAECGGNKPAVIAFAQNQREEVRAVGDKAVSLAAEAGMHCQTFVALDMSHACDVIRDCGEVPPSLQARMGTGGNQVPLTYQMQGFGDYHAGEVASSCKQRDFKDSTDLVVCAIDCRNFREVGETNGTLQAKSNGGTSCNLQNTVRTGMIVRRLTPMECERLQGFPDGWTDIGEWRDSKGKLRKPSDSPRYKALGNSIALPFWDFLAKRISAQYLRPVTMGSLFDGIGGFPLVFERHNGKGTARWASEIEKFPIAVTKLRFGED